MLPLDKQRVRINIIGCAFLKWNALLLGVGGVSHRVISDLTTMAMIHVALRIDFDFA